MAQKCCIWTPKLRLSKKGNLCHDLPWEQKMILSLLLTLKLCFLFGLHLCTPILTILNTSASSCTLYPFFAIQLIQPGDTALNSELLYDINKKINDCINKTWSALQWYDVRFMGECEVHEWIFVQTSPKSPWARLSVTECTAGERDQVWVLNMKLYRVTTQICDMLDGVTVTPALEKVCFLLTFWQFNTSNSRTET